MFLSSREVENMIGNVNNG